MRFADKQVCFISCGSAEVLRLKFIGSRMQFLRNLLQGVKALYYALMVVIWLCLHVLVTVFGKLLIRIDGVTKMSFASTDQFRWQTSWPKRQHYEAPAGRDWC